MDNTVRTVKIFEFYVKYIWPIHRVFVKGKYAKRCLTCAASEKMVSIDSSGICSLCKNTHAAVMSRETLEEDRKQLSDLLSNHQGAGHYQYDALVLFSGGKDSTYMIARIKKEFPKLRMLAYTIDNGFMSTVARQNVQDFIGLLDVDHVFVRPEHKFYIKLFRYCLTHLNADGGYGTLDFSDGEFMLDTARRIAAEKHIPLILCGYSRYQVQNGLKFHNFESPLNLEMADRQETAGIALKDIFEPSEINRWWHGSQWPQDQVARLIFPLYAWDLEEAEIKQKVTEWGLLTKKEYSPAVTNHQLIPVLGVVDVHQRGYSSFEPEFCRMIREGKANRYDWQMTFEFLEYTSRTGLFLKPIVIQKLAELNLEPGDVGIKFNVKDAK